MVLVTERMINAARLDGLHYFFAIEFKDGRTVCQYEEDGKARGLADERHRILQKDPTDPYPTSVVILDAKVGILVPVFPELEQVVVEVKDNCELVLFRRNYMPTKSPKYVVYCLGTRQIVEGTPIETVLYVCPRLDWSVQDDWGTPHYFMGAMEWSRDPLFRNPYDRFLDKVGAHVERLG